MGPWAGSRNGGTVDTVGVDRLREMVEARRLADLAEIGLVVDLRAAGVTWDEIAAALGVSRQAAAKKFG